MQPSLRTSLLLAAMAATLACLPLTGCADGGPPRTALWGKVTWKGQPIPRGVIYFGPDGSKGNTGPQGYALIVDGLFHTRQAPGKGCVTGPHIVQIKGYTGQNISDGRPYGDPLFSDYETSLEVAWEQGEIELVVPDAAKAAPPIAKEPE